MKTLTPKILAYLLGIPEADAMQRIHAINERISGNNKLALKPASKDDKVTIEVKVYEKYTGEAISLAIDSIQKNYLKNTATRSYIRDYPQAKLKPAKKNGFYPKTVSLPPVLRTLLTPEQKAEILTIWNTHYAEHPAIKKNKDTQTSLTVFV